jgi:hypothetical protein
MATTAALSGEFGASKKNAQHHVEYRPVALHEVVQPFRNRQHPLAHRQAGEAVIRQVRCRLHHAPRVARGADTPAFAGIGDEVVVSTIVTRRAVLTTPPVNEIVKILCNR